MLTGESRLVRERPREGVREEAPEALRRRRGAAQRGVQHPDPVRRRGRQTEAIHRLSVRNRHSTFIYRHEEPVVMSSAPHGRVGGA